MSFQSYEFVKYLGYDQKTNEYRYEYKIIDDDWVGVTVGQGVSAAVGDAVAVGVAVIQEYSKRGLPVSGGLRANASVAANLVRAFQWYSQNYGYSIEQIIAWNKQYSPKFKQYEEDIEKYLVLL
jgi:hypothetical protein